jgi:septal ring factor EnvC (AmiA/AmiB activator)
MQRLIMLACLAAAAAVALVAWNMLAPRPVDHSAARQIAQMQQALIKQGKALIKAQQDNASLADRLSAVEGGMASLAPFDKVCSQYLTGPNGGPSTFFFLCTDQKP